MENLLGRESEAFFTAYNREPLPGLRLNTLKIQRQDFLQRSSFSLRPIPWASNGFYYEKEQRPGKHPYHDAGLYYIQEPSAMAVAELVDPQPGERVLDLCAAPGGKTTQLAAMMKNAGLLISNEIHPARAKILSQNVERLGLCNTVVTNEDPEGIARHFKGFFDRVLVDAPCSGEGMFRKDEATRGQWSLDHVALCAKRQRLILDQIKGTVKPGGRLVYSTCTFSTEENEDVMEWFTKENPEFYLEETAVYEGFSSTLPGTWRLWPHHLEGEGHFVAVLRKTDGEEPPKIKYHKGRPGKSAWMDFKKFMDEALTKEVEGQLLLFGENLYRLPEGMAPLDKLKIVRPGLHLGILKKNRFEPAHALALALKKEEAVMSRDLSVQEAEAFLKGEVLSCSSEKGWSLITVDGYSLGWAKASAGLLKNHYPKGLRWK